MNDYNTFFEKVTGHTPHPWQAELGQTDAISDRLIRIPTGMGKTVGVLASWLYHRVENQSEPSHKWPTRLVWCLPMRTLVDQTESEANKLIEKAGLTDQVDVEVLMGGRDESRWVDYPERPKILIGTQDMLLSRALNRGYAMGRAAWPRAFGLLNNDSLWIMDEVQLMGVGLATSAQLQAFWHSDQQQQDDTIGPRTTWWMSATLQPDWLKTHQTMELIPKLAEEQLRIAPDARTGKNWNAEKPVQRIEANEKTWANKVVEVHQKHNPDSETGRQTLVVVNRVAQAIDLYESIAKQLKTLGAEAPKLKLIHSRFRPNEREEWKDKFLSRESLSSDTNRILISTQVVEAGVDISASCMVTQLAPWPSLVQRFGRAARYGGNAQVVILDPLYADEKKSAPYEIQELDAARNAIDQLDDVSIGSLEEFEDQLAPKDLSVLYPYAPLHILQKEELDELFDTSPDLSGADMDISRFIREGENRDVSVFWRSWDDNKPPIDYRPDRHELCSVSIAEAKPWLQKLRKRGDLAFTWDYLDGAWTTVDPFNLRPGMIILVKPEAGGYSNELGFTGRSPIKKEPVQQVEISLDQQGDADRSEQNDSNSILPVWKTIATHCREAEDVGKKISSDVGLWPKHQPIVSAALRLHDWGKAHPAFAEGTYRVTPKRSDLAKAPTEAWPKSFSNYYKTTSHGHRRGFRHELASCLAALELLRQTDPMHDAILGQHAELMLACGLLETDPGEEESTAIQTGPIGTELNQWSRQQFNLLLYLIASHHGKVRVSLQASPIDQEYPTDDKKIGTGIPIRGVREGDIVPAIELPTAQEFAKTPDLQLSLSTAAIGLNDRYGASWTERISELINNVGPFTLAYLEAIVRAADCRASVESQSPGNLPDPRLDGIELQVGSDNQKTSVSVQESCEEPTHA